MVYSSTIGHRGARRRSLLAAAGAALVAGAAALAGCAALMTHDLTLTESQITLALARKFPMDRKVLEVIDLTIANPQIQLMPETNRVGTELDVTAVDRLFGNSAHGHLSVDYGLRFEPSDHSIRMTQVRVRDLTLDAGANSLHGVAQRLGLLVAENALENQSLYKMKPEQADEMDRLNLMASPIRVTAQGLTMTLSPKPN